jgi:hypothetical protein
MKTRRNRGKWVMYDGPNEVAVRDHPWQLFQLADSLGIDPAGCHVGRIEEQHVLDHGWEEPDPPAPDEEENPVSIQVARG